MACSSVAPYTILPKTTRHNHVRLSSPGPVPQSSPAVERWGGKDLMIQRLIANPIAVLVEPSQGLLKEPGLRITLRHGSLRDVEPVRVHVDRGQRARLVSVGEVQLMPSDEVDVVPQQMRHLGVSFHELPRRVDDGACQVGLPVPRTGRCASSPARFRTRGAGLGFLREDSLELTEVGHRQGVAALAKPGGVHPRWQVRAKLRFVSGLGDLWLAGEVGREPILPAYELDPFLSEGSPDENTMNAAATTGIRRMTLDPPSDNPVRLRGSIPQVKRL